MKLLWNMAAVVVLVLVMIEFAVSQPQANLINQGCSQVNASFEFFSNLNTTLANLRRQLSVNRTHFATAELARSSSPVYAVVQCRNYLSTADCVSCFDIAAVDIRKYCRLVNGARVIYDGCFLRYETNRFYGTANALGNAGRCDNGTIRNGTASATSYNVVVDALLSNLVIATPKTKNFYAATVTEVAPGGNTTVYAMAQCAETVTEFECQNCMNVAYENIKSCPPRIGARAFDAGCFMRYTNTPFFASNQTINISRYLRSGGSSNKKAIIGGVVGGVGFLLLVLVLILRYRLSRKKKISPRGNVLGSTELQGPVTYNYKDLKSATKNFSNEYKLGEGGSGDVYKGIVKNGNIVAVKRLALSTSKAKADFESEVRLISNVHHRNLVRLLGCSSKGPDLLLVYEYMENGSLDSFLYGGKQGTLNWQQRLLPEDQTHLNTKFAGTLGYTAPEYALQGQLSEKVDTYSFGVVLLEIVSGRRCSDTDIESDTDFLLEYAWKLHENDMHLNLVDETLDSDKYRPEDVKKVIEIALMCTQSPASLRPTMSEVVVMLISDRSLELVPLSRPTFVYLEDRIRDGSAIPPPSMSNATATLSEFTGR
ncbi:Cysteine-rich RLK (Receptor-like kinase) protein [Heracleum sosnowskyi]|uniref:Cysteine-rich RLK (Receptor-like kinase) protein n=1 Tax=Heracleum sosnowskyi TaxID=360622 RepID=A0AAD8NBR3_9APIA|nr:Cysteine-rich RLK (Receptor-like kinase) protein [Heracleum sosnowskyi]